MFTLPVIALELFHLSKFYLDEKTPLLKSALLILTVGLCLNIFCVGQAARGSAKNMSQQKGSVAQKVWEPLFYIYSSLGSTPFALCAFDCSRLFFTVVLSAPHHQPGTSFQLFQVGIPQISNSPQNLDFVRRFPRKSKKFINLGPTSENFWSPYFKTSIANLLKTFMFLNFPLLSF